MISILLQLGIVNNTATHTRNISIAGIMAALGGFLSFTVLDTFIKWYSQYYSSLELSYIFRIFVLLLSSLVLLLICLARRSFSIMRPQHIRSHIIRGILTFFMTYCFTYTFATLPLSTAYSLIFMLPIFTALLVSFTIKEKIPRLVWMAIVIGFVGMLIVVRPGIAPWNWGYVSALVAVLCEAPFFILARRYHRNEHPLVVVFYSQLIALVVYFIVFSLILDINISLKEISHIWAMIMMGIFNILAQTLIIFSLKSNDANISTSMQYSQVIWGALIGYFIFGDLTAFNPFFLVGTCIIIVSGYVVSTGRLPFQKKL